MTNEEVLIEELKKNRQNDFRFHLTLGRDWLNFGVMKKYHSSLVYSAFEFRIAIERYIFEFFFLIKKNEGFKEKHENKTVKLESLIAEIYKSVGGKEIYLKKIKFNKIIASFEKPRINLTEPDLEYLFKLWKRLSKFCHKQLKPNESWINNNEFVQKGYLLLKEVTDFFYENSVEKRVGWFTEDLILHDDFKNLREDFISEKLDEVSFTARYNIMHPMFNLSKKLREQLLK